MENCPLVTIFFLAYNCEKFLEKAIQPILEQTYPNIEIIISNNQSTDNTEEIIRQIQKKNPKIIYRKNILSVKSNEVFDIDNQEVSNKKNIKQYDACFNHANSCLNSGLAKGEFILFCHQDDLYEKEIVEKEVKFLMENPEVPVVFTLGNIIDKNDKKTGAYKLPKDLKGKKIYNFFEIFKAILNHGNTFLIAPTFMARKEIFEKVGLFDDQGPFGGADDLDMWLRILEKYPIGIIPENLINWRNGGRGKKSNNLRTWKSDFTNVMDYYLLNKGYAQVANKKDLRQYEYLNDFDSTLRATNFLIKEQIKETKSIINTSFSLNNFIAFLENISILRIKMMSLKIILFLGINLGLGRYLGKVLRKII